LEISPVEHGLGHNKSAITAAPTSIQSIGMTSSARVAKYQVYRPFSGNRRGGQVETLSITGRATQEIAGLRENYNIGAVDWAVIDASGTPLADFEAMPNPDRSFRGGLGPMAQNSNVAVPEISH
jgi:hypothetical protein